MDFNNMFATTPSQSTGSSPPFSPPTSSSLPAPVPAPTFLDHLQSAPAAARTEAQILSQIHVLQQQLESVRRGDAPEAAGVAPDAAAALPPSGADTPSALDILSPGPRAPRLIVVANRLPATLTKTPDGSWNFRISSGGLVSALAGVKKSNPFIWVGWTGVEVAPAEHHGLRDKFLEEMSCYPVFLSELDANLYYNGFCNDVLWPLFHYVPLPILSGDGERKFDIKYWHAYCKANSRFAEAVIQIYRPGDLIWVQDFHLMLLPSLLRARLRDATIGFFLHTPFPSSEVYRMLPMRNKVLQGVLAADLIGFHTYDYASHFLSVCTRILGLDASPKGVSIKDHFAHVSIFPIGIDANTWLNALSTPEVRERISDLEHSFRGKKIILGVDRLDYIKGLPHKLMAFEILLASQPQWKDKVVLVQIGVPSRTEVDEYKKLISQTNELVGRINAQYGSVEHSPIAFINQNVDFNVLCALYAVADVMLVTSIRDGMNLVSYEYVVCQRGRHGVLVLSEFAGSAQSLSSAIRVNPWNIEELATAMHEALTLPPRERALKHERLFQYVRKHTAAFWAQSFIKELRQIEANVKAPDLRKPAQTLLRVSVDVLPEMRARTRRLFLLEYEGTLVEPVALPDLAMPTTSLCRFLQRLSAFPDNFVYIMSGRSRETLEGWFGDLHVGLIAEHGCDYRHPGAQEWQSIVDTSNELWKPSVYPILQYFKERTPGAHVETKEKCITWHFRDADPYFGSWQAKELKLHLAETCMNLPVEVISGPKYLELRPEEVSHLAAVQRIIAELPCGIDFAFAIGSDRADEEVFSFLKNLSRAGSCGEASGLGSCGNEEGDVVAITVRVGGKSDSSAADRYVPDSEIVFRILKELAPSQAVGAAAHQPRSLLGNATAAGARVGTGTRSGPGVGLNSGFFSGVRRRGSRNVLGGNDLLFRVGGQVPRSSSYDAGMTGIRTAATGGPFERAVDKGLERVLGSGGGVGNGSSSTSSSSRAFVGERGIGPSPLMDGNAVMNSRGVPPLGAAAGGFEADGDETTTAWTQLRARRAA